MPQSARLSEGGEGVQSLFGQCPNRPVIFLSGASLSPQLLHLYKNGVELPESLWYLSISEGALNNNMGGTGSRIVVSKLLPKTCQM